MLHLLAFLATGAALVVAGVALARHADTIADATGLGRLWIGSLLLAGATSLPEAATDVAAVRLGAADLAAGDLFGSSMANMLVLAVIDLLPPRRQVFRQAALDHALAAAHAIALTALAGVLVFAHPDVTVAGVGPGSLLLAVLYVAGMRAVYRQSRRAPAAPASPPARSERPSRRDLRRALAAFTGATIVVAIAAPAFSWSAKGLAEITGLSTTFLGAWLVGLTTSLPELVASLAAVRAGSFDLAVGNLFGSNAFNMALFLALDLAQPGGAIFAALDVNHVLTSLAAVVLMSLGLAAIMYRAERRFALIEPGSWLMVATYALGLWMLYLRAH